MTQEEIDAWCLQQYRGITATKLSWQLKAEEAQIARQQQEVKWKQQYQQWDIYPAPWWQQWLHTLHSWITQYLLHR